MLRRVAQVFLIFLCIFLLVSEGSAYARSRSKKAVLVNLTGGLNTNTSSLALPQNELTHATNIDYTTFGARNKRGGSTLHNTSAIANGATIIGLYEWEKSDGSRLFFAAADDGKIYKDSAGTWSSVATGYTTDANNQWTWANWQGSRVIACDNEGPAQTSTDGSTWTTLTTTPSKCKVPIVHRRRLFIIDVDSSTIYYSTLNDPTDFTGGSSGSFSVVSSEGGFLTGAASHLGLLFIFKERSIHILRGDSPTSTDPDPFILEPLIIGVGAVSHNSIAAVTGPEGSDLMFASKFGVVSLKNISEFGDFRPALLSDKIRPDWRSLSSTRLKNTSAVFYPRKGEYWLSVAESGSSSNNTVLKYTLLNKAWSRIHTPMAMNILANRRDSATEDLMVYTGDEDGYVWLLDANTTNDNSKGYEGYYKTAWLDMGRPDIKKSFGPKLTVFTEASGDYNLVVSYEIDFSAETRTLISLKGGCVGIDDFILDEDLFCAAQDISRAVATSSIRGEGTWIRLGFSNDKAGETFKVFGFILEYSEMED